MSNGEIALCGWTRSTTLTFNGTQYSSAGNEDMMVAWLSSTGNVNNGMTFGNSGTEMLHDCKVDGNGKTIAVGEFSSSSLVLNQTTISHGGGTGSDSIVLRVSPQTGVEWVRLPIAAGHDRAMSVVVDAAGNIFVAGEHKFNNSGSRSITWGSIQLSQGADHATGLCGQNFQRRGDWVGASSLFVLQLWRIPRGCGTQSRSCGVSPRSERPHQRLFLLKVRFW